MDEQSPLAFEALNRIILSLHDDALPVYNRIINFFYVLMKEIYFDKATVLFYYKGNDEKYSKHSSISINWNEENVKKYNEYYCGIDDTLPILDRQTPIIFRSSDFFNKKVREASPYYKEYLLPNNCVYSIDANIPLGNASRYRAAFCFYRGKENNDFTENELRIARLFQPHLSIILRDYLMEEALPPGLPSFLEDSSYMGIGIIGEDYKIVHCNKAFEKLTAPQNQGNDIFRKIVQLCQNFKSSGNSGSRVPFEHKLDDEPIFLAVSPIPPKSDSERSEYCCLIYDLSHFYIHTLRQAKDKYQLTPREMDILRSVLKGHSNERISKELFISLPTTKKYLTSIYDKMDIQSSKQIFEKLKLL